MSSFRVPRMEIPVFVSCPSDLTPDQEKTALLINNFLVKNRLSWRGLGRSDFPYHQPLAEVVGMMKRCSGGIILGFSQFYADAGVYKKNTGVPARAEKNIVMPTPWNNLEAGIMYAYDIPTLVFAEEGIKGGIFDIGTPNVFVHKLPVGPSAGKDNQYDELETLIQNWASDVKAHYYGRRSSPQNI